MSTLSLKVEFGGGLELLFSNQRSHKVSIPALVPVSASASGRSADAPTSSSAAPSSTDTSEAPRKPADLAFLIHWLRDHLLQERAELFVEDGTV